MSENNASEPNANPTPSAPEPRVEDLPELAPEQASPVDEDKIRGGGGAYIAEVEKNIDAVLRPAQRTDASLLFGESDSLFKR